MDCGFMWSVWISTIYHRPLTVPLHSPCGRQFACHKGCARGLWKSPWCQGSIVGCWLHYAIVTYTSGESWTRELMEDCSNSSVSAMQLSQSHTDLAQGCGDSNVSSMELPQSCSKSPIFTLYWRLHICSKKYYSIQIHWCYNGISFENIPRILGTFIYGITEDHSSSTTEWTTVFCPRLLV